MEELREKLVELKILLEIQNNRISNFIEKVLKTKSERYA